MTRLILMLIIVGLGGCASLTADKAPGCAGARRPANPYGSVLTPDAPAPAATTGGQCLGGRP